MDEIQKFYGERIADAAIVDNQLRLLFASGRSIIISDEASYCCERRHMSSDDDLQSLVGRELQRVEIKDGPSYDGEYEQHDQQFLEVGTDVGFVTVVNHNEHNGYYSGFEIRVTEGERKQDGPW